MSQYSTEPEFSVEVLEKTHHSTAQSKAIRLVSLVEVEAELALLSKELTMSVDILGKIRDSVLVLGLSLGEQE